MARGRAGALPMNDELRHEIVRRYQGGASLRRITRDLGLARETVQTVIRRWQAARAGDADAGPTPRRRRPSQVDPFVETIRQLLVRYPDITIVRVFEELRQHGYRGGLTMVRERVLELRPPASPTPTCCPTCCPATTRAARRLWTARPTRTSDA